MPKGDLHATPARAAAAADAEREGAADGEPTLSQQLTERRESSRSGPASEQRQVMEKAQADLAASDIIERSLDVGDPAPEFTLEDARGESVSLASLRESGPVVITFYRGGWCPYCDLALRAMQREVAELESAGATLVAIAPETVSNAATTQREANLDFALLSDEGSEVAREFGIVFTVPPDLREVYRGFGIDLEAQNATDTWELPLPATYIVDRDGVIRWRWIDTDYTRRAEPADVVEALKALDPA